MLLQSIENDRQENIRQCMMFMKNMVKILYKVDRAINKLFEWEIIVVIPIILTHSNIFRLKFLITAICILIA